MTDTQRNGERMLSALLGPVGAELSCEQCFDLLDVYAERELAAASPDESVPGMREHLIGCPACAEEHDSLLALLRQTA